MGEHVSSGSHFQSTYLFTITVVTVLVDVVRNKEEDGGEEGDIENFYRNKLGG